MNTLTIARHHFSCVAVRFALLTIGCTLLVPACSQDTCTCTRDLDLYISKVERNYAGFQDKVTATTRPRYNALVDSARSVAMRTTGRAACFDLLDTYRAYFWDKHLQLGGAYVPTDDGGTPTPPRTSAWTAAALERHYTVQRENLRALEGKWSLEGYRVGIVRNDSLKLYDAVIVASENERWKEGMVKFTLTEPTNGRCSVRYWRGDMALFETTGIHAPGHLAIKGIGTWHRADPPTGAMSPHAFELTYGEEVQWKMLDDSTLYIKLGSCDLANKAILDSLVRTHAEHLKTVPRWIVDFRANGGGSTDVFQSLLPYLYTKPFIEYGVSHWMSTENTALLKGWFDENRPQLDTNTITYLEEITQAGLQHPGTWHHGGMDTTRYDAVLPMPRRVAILADRGTASSGESFLEIARGMSDKSVIFGENTGGYMDYGDLQPHDLGCDGLIAAIPTSRMARLDHGLRFDATGITPDVRIGAEEKDWIAAVRQYWVTLR